LISINLVQKRKIVSNKLVGDKEQRKKEMKKIANTMPPKCHHIAKILYGKDPKQ
jgi:hypothetical protein